MLKKTLLLGTTLMVAATPALAQDSSGDEIIVTATKRAKTLQEVPLSVSVTTADVIEKAQILDIKDLQSVVPTFRVSQLQNSANTSLAIRGFGNGGNNLGIEPAVGVFIDGVYRSRAAAQIGDLPNLERVEVLSGPQSTLFGKNASAGVVSVVTSAPSYETGGYVEAGYGRFNQMYAKGFVEGAVTDNMAVSLGLGFQQRDGYFVNLAEADDFNEIDRWNMRGQIMWEPSDDTSFRLIFDRSTIDENCCGTGVAIDGPFAAGQPDVRVIIGSLGGNQPSSANQFSYETYGNSNSQNEIKDRGVSLESKFKMGNIDVTSITAYRANDSDYGSDSDYNSLEFLKNVYQNVDIRTFTQELRFDVEVSDKVDVMLGGYYFDESIDQDSGLLYGDDTRTYIDILAGGAAVLGGVEAILGYAPGTFFADDTTIDEFATQDNEAISLFGNADFELTDKLTLSMGLNYTQDKKNVSLYTENNDVFGNIDFSGAEGRAVLTGLSLSDNFPAVAASCGLGALAFSPANVGAVLGAPACFIDAAGNTAPGSVVYPGFAASVAASVAAIPQAAMNDATANPLGAFFGLQFQPQLLAYPNAVEDGITDNNKLTYTGQFNYEVNDTINIYGRYATGFKSASWNLTRDSRPFQADALALAAAGLLPNNYVPSTGRNFGTRYSEPETSEVVEIGFKAKGDWGTFNFAAFDQTIENFQSTIFQGTGFVLANAGTQSTRGIEWDSTFKLMDPLHVTFAGVLQDPVYDSFPTAPGPNGTVIDLSGQRPAGINELALSTSATYTHDFSDAISGFVRADYQYESDVQIVDNIAGLTRSTNIINASAGVGFDSGVSFMIWARNLNNDQSYTSAFPGVVQGSTINAYPSQPRTYGASVRYKF